MPTRFWLIAGGFFAFLMVAYATLNVLFPQAETAAVSRVAELEGPIGLVGEDGTVTAVNTQPEAPARAPITTSRTLTPEEAALNADLLAFQEEHRPLIPLPDTRATDPAVTMTGISVLDTNLRLQHQLSIASGNFDVAGPQTILPGLVAVPCEMEWDGLARFTPYIGTACYEVEQRYYEGPCADGTIVGFLERGALVKYVYLDENNLDLVHVVVSATECGLAVAAAQ